MAACASASLTAILATGAVAAPASPVARRLQSWWFGWNVSTPLGLTQQEPGGWFGGSAPPPWDERFVDPDTPAEVRYTSALGDGALYRLVMSDEFETEGRRFGEADGDSRWTAVSRHDPTNGNLAYMTPQMVSTRNGCLEIITTNTGFRAALYASASLQSWSKAHATTAVARPAPASPRLSVPLRAFPRLSAPLRAPPTLAPSLAPSLPTQTINHHNTPPLRSASRVAWWR